MGTNSGMINFVFHNASEESGTGTELSIQRDYMTANVEVSGTSTDYTISFEGKSIDGGSFYTLKAMNLTTLTSSAEITKGLWQVDLNGLIKFRVNLSAIVDGNITAKGRVVD